MRAQTYSASDLFSPDKLRHNTVFWKDALQIPPSRGFVACSRGCSSTCSGTGSGTGSGTRTGTGIWRLVCGGVFCQILGWAVKRLITVLTALSSGNYGNYGDYANVNPPPPPPV